MVLGFVRSKPIMEEKMNIALVLEIVFFGIAAVYLIFTLFLLFKDKKILFKDKMLFILISLLLLGRNVSLIISGFSIRKTQ